MRMCLVGDTLDGEEGSGGERFFRIIIKRLEGTGDLELVAQRYAQRFNQKLTISLGLVHICLRFGEREESRLYKDLVTILENLHIRRYVSVGDESCRLWSAHHPALDAYMSKQYCITSDPDLPSSLRFNPKSAPDKACPTSPRCAPGEIVE